MTDLADAFTLYFVTLGPLKTVPAFDLITQGADRTMTMLAVRSAILTGALVVGVASAWHPHRNSTRARFPRRLSARR
jgi:hypothetical protein